MSGGAPLERRTMVLVAIVALIVAAGAAIQRLRAGVSARAAHPMTDGLIVAAGLGAPVQIDRDARGVPHVSAENAADAFFALGFAHAQDRLGQMQWLLRTARGRTAEVVGDSGVASDRLARALDLGGLADAEFEGLDGRSRGWLEAYARGVNARIERILSGGVAPPTPFERDRIDLERWRPADSLALLKLYAWGLSNSLDVSIVLSELIERLGGVGARMFFPPDSGGAVVPAPLPVTAQRARGVEGRVFDALRRNVRLTGHAVGSSAWVIGGAHTRSGRPVLVADSHLEPTAPSLFYVAHLRGGELNVAGATIPGLPVFWTGHNDRVAWASTHARVVSMDLYTETLHPSDPERYHDGRRWRDLSIRSERIAVRGGEDIEFTVRATRHGPLLEGLEVGAMGPLAIAWVGARRDGGGSLAAFFEVARAADADSLRAALEGLRDPVLAVVYADHAGAAGMQVAGWIPQRSLPTGLVPVPGRARWYDWQGRVPFAELPRMRLREGKGWAIAADNRLARPGRSEWLWRTGERAQRIDELLSAAVNNGPVELREMAQLQGDVVEVGARAMVTRCLALAGDPGGLGPEVREVAGLLRDWDGHARAESVGAAVYHLFLANLVKTILVRPLGEDLLARYRVLPQVDPRHVVSEIMDSVAEGREAGGWTSAEELGEAVRASLRETWFSLAYRLGANRRKWHWGRLHPLSFPGFGPLDAGADGAPGLGPFDYGGSGHTINTGEYAPGESFAVRVASTYRFAIDTAALDQSLSSLAPGQSGQPGHPHYRDAVAGWLKARPELLATSALLVEESSVARLTIEPPP